jgi:hypothetical protein
LIKTLSSTERALRNGIAKSLPPSSRVTPGSNLAAKASGAP